MKIKKRNWKSSRKVLPAFIGIARSDGRASKPSPSLPPECHGKFTITIVVMDDEELVNALKNMFGGNDE